MLAHYQYGGPPEYEGISESLFQLYRMRTAQCLLSGDISKCLPYTVETLRFNATAELNRKDDNRRGLWIMTGVVVRAAINMGYHLDPSDSPEFSLLQAEYRRRTWLSIIRMDDMASFLGGFPRLGSAIPSTTREPLNLHDWELSEKTMILPPSRPLTEPTAATYLIVKGRLFYALGRVADLNSIPSLASYETVLDVDRAVHSAYQNVPPHMKEFSISGDNSGPIRGRTQFSHLGLLCMYHKGMCVLHRKFLAKDRGNDRFKVSRDRCISSALALLDLQIELQPSFYKISQTRQMLTLAAMILFLELELRRKSPNLEASPDSGLLFHVLEQSCAHWAEAVSACDDTRRIHEFLEHMLSSFKPGRGTEPGCPEILPEAQLRSQRLSPWSSAADLGFSFEDNLSTMDFDWVRHSCLILRFGLTDDDRLHGMLLLKRLAKNKVRFISHCMTTRLYYMRFWPRDVPCLKCNQSYEGSRQPDQPAEMHASRAYSSEVLLSFFNVRYTIRYDRWTSVLGVVFNTQHDTTIFVGALEIYSHTAKAIFRI